MANKNEVTLTFAGDTAQLEKSFEKVDEAAGGLETSVKKASRATDDHANATARLGEKADNSERNLIGVHDVIDGTATIMKGPGEQGIVAYVQGWADLAGGAAPLLMSLSSVSLATAKAGISSTVAGARTVAGWIAARVAAMASAVQIAAAWLISLGPVVLVVAGIAAVVAAFVILWNKSAAFRNFWRGVWSGIQVAAGAVGRWFAGPFVNFWVSGWNRITSFFSRAKGTIAAVFRGIGDAISAPFRAAFDAIRSAWNNTVGGFGFSVPDWVPKIGGNGFHIPRMHTGGVVPGAPGSEMLAILQAGETVTPAGAGGVLRIELVASRGSGVLAEVIHDLIDRRALQLRVSAQGRVVRGT